MHGYWPFEVVEPAGPRRRAFVLFCSAPNPDVNDVVQCIVDYCDTRRPPDRIYLIAPESDKRALDAVVAASSFTERIRDVTQSVDQPRSVCLLFDADGGLKDGEGRPVPPDQVALIKRLGLTYLIRSHPVYLVAPPAHHFVVPSGAHADVFFRIGSALSDGAAIDFIAFCALPCIPRDVKHIYCDTGAISPVAYAVNTLRGRIVPGAAAATVSSFGSYKGAPGFRFKDMDRSVILLSVSTTGKLASALCEIDRNIQESDIVTLFALHAGSGSGKIVCDLRRDEGNLEGFSDVHTYAALDCPLCEEGSTKIVISTEQFLPGRGKTEALILRVSHSPRWLSPFLKQLVGTKIIRANYKSANTNHASREVFFDLQALFADSQLLGIEPYRTRLWKTVDREVPAKLTRIICLDSPASRTLGERIKARLGAHWSDVPVLSYADILRDPTPHIQDAGAVLVVAAAAASGRSLLAVSQLLRHIQTNGAITYLIGLARFPDRDTMAEVEGNVSYGEQARERGFHVIDRVFLPLMGSRTKTSWEFELELLDEALLAPPDETTRELLESRSRVIRGAADEQGVSDGLFWGKFDGALLTLRPGFAFFDFDVERAPSQADVYFTIVTVLHGLRCDPHSSESLFQHEYLRRVLSPRCFDRFNDGVIQASILRAAHPAELDYSIDEKLSNDMWQVLDTIFDSRTTQAGEATLEFLLALALNRLKLESSDLAKLKDKFSEAMEHPIARALWRKIGNAVNEASSGPTGQ